MLGAIRDAIHQKITRRDFLNGTLLASGAALVSAACPFQLMAAEDWNGAPGIGDYAGANGNTHQVMADGHAIRDHAFDRATAAIQDTGEIYDCVVVGGGISGLSAALFYQRATARRNPAWCSKTIRSLAGRRSATNSTWMGST